MTNSPSRDRTTIAPWLLVADASAAADFYRRAFGAVVGEQAEFDGVLQVAELRIDDAPLWVQRDEDLPADLDPGAAVRMIIAVADPDAAFRRAIEAGGRQVAAVHDEHGWRTGRLVDPFGHQWELALRTDTTQEPAP